MYSEIVERFAQGAELPARAVAGLSREDLAAHPVPGTWSIAEIVLHLMDSDLVAVDRIKRIIAMQRPLLIGYDETAFAAKLEYEKADVAMAAEAFRLNRLMLVPVLRGLGSEAWERWGVHNEKGKVTLAEMVQGYCEHLEHHLRFLYRKRELLLKPMA
jgi:hypothetical protein